MVKDENWKMMLKYMQVISVTSFQAGVLSSTFVEVQLTKAEIRNEGDSLK